jgi:hypothetical protein
VRLVSLVAIAPSITQPALAQSGSARPLPVFRGLFGPDERESTRPRSLDLTWNVCSAQDDNLQQRLEHDADGDGHQPSPRAVCRALHLPVRYQFANGVGLPPMLTPSVDRQRARLGLTRSTPLVQ